MQGASRRGHRCGGFSLPAQAAQEEAVFMGTNIAAPRLRLTRALGS